jgi:hypothetical protein
VPPQWQNDSAAAPSGASALDTLETCYWNYGAGCLSIPPTITGNLLWTIQVVYQAYELNRNETLLREQIWPLLRLAVNFYTHWQIDNRTDTQIHLPPTFSPEYAVAPDCNYDLALYRWGLTTALATASHLGIQDPNAPLWMDTLNRLTPYPRGADGFWIGAGVPLSSSHRHFSHLFMIFPLKQLDFADPAQMTLATTSIDHWLSMTEGLTGFCRTAASSMNVLLERPHEAYTNITFLVDNYILPNTFYQEGENGECGETPPAASSAVTDWMLMEWGGVVRIFAGLDDSSISDAAFYHLRAPDAFLVSATRSGGQTHFVFIESELGFPLYIDPGLALPLEISPSSIPNVVFSNGTVFLQIPAGESVLITSTNNPPQNLSITASPGNASEFNYWGYPIGPPRLYLAPCDGSPHQSFSWTQQPGTQISPSIDATKCLTVQDCSASNGSPIVLTQYAYTRTLLHSHSPSLTLSSLSHHTQIGVAHLAAVRRRGQWGRRINCTTQCRRVASMSMALSGQRWICGIATPKQSFQTLRGCSTQRMARFAPSTQTRSSALGTASQCHDEGVGVCVCMYVCVCVCLHQAAVTSRPMMFTASYDFFQESLK